MLLLEQLVAKADSQPFHGLSVYTRLGLYARVGVARLHASLGDHALALDFARPLELSSKSPLTRVVHGFVAGVHSIAFSLLLTRRYDEAIRTLSTALLYIARTEQYHAASTRYTDFLRSRTFMHATLALGLALEPLSTAADEQVVAATREAHGDAIARVRAGDEGALDALLRRASIPLLPPATFGGQAAVLRRDVALLASFPSLRSYLRLYSSLPLAKLAALRNASEDATRREVMAYARRATNDTRVRIDADDVVHVTLASAESSSAEFFARNITKFKELREDVAALRARPTRAGRA